MTKTPNPSVRLFSSMSANTRPIIKTPNGPIYAGTPEAEQYMAAKAWADPLQALAAGFASMAYDKAQALASIAALLPKIPEGSGSTAAVLYDLGEAMQGRLSNRTGTGFQDVAGAYAYHVASLRDHAARAQDSLPGYVYRAPKPPHPEARQPDPGQPLGTGHRQRADY